MSSWNKWSKRMERKKEKDQEEADKQAYFASMTPEERARYERRCEINRQNALSSPRTRQILAGKSKQDYDEIKKTELRDRGNREHEAKKIAQANAKIVDEAWASVIFEDILNDRAGVKGNNGHPITDEPEDDVEKEKREFDEQVKRAKEQKAKEEEEIRQREEGNQI